MQRTGIHQPREKVIDGNTCFSNFPGEASHGASQACAYSSGKAHVGIRVAYGERRDIDDAAEALFFHRLNGIALRALHVYRSDRADDSAGTPV